MFYYKEFYYNNKNIKCLRKQFYLNLCFNLCFRLPMSIQARCNFEYIIFLREERENLHLLYIYIYIYRKVFSILSKKVKYSKLHRCQAYIDMGNLKCKFR